MTALETNYTPTSIAQGVRGDFPPVSWPLVNPAMAAEWLSGKAVNRSLRPQKIATYAADMAAGAWQMTGEAIKFDKMGQLIDGQHRLTAIVQSGCTVRLLVVRGLDTESQLVMDTGTARTAGDALGLSGHRNSNQVAAVARLGVVYDSGAIQRARQATSGTGTLLPSHTQIAEWVEAHPQVQDAVQVVTKYPGKSKAAAALAFIKVSAIDDEEAREFFRRLCEGDLGGIGDPVQALHRRLVNAHIQREILSQSMEMHFIFRAWNAQRKGESITKLGIKSSTTPLEIPV